ncbi:MAG: putative ABC transporter permease [Bacilli bacterium]|nr:putative ABC transporter permease [Bacilli bacterium]
MLEQLKLYFLYFIIYAMIGWFLEEIYAYGTKKKITNRGFFIGPYCPIYGIGCILIILLLSSYKEHPAGMFVLAIIICSVLEYITSYLMEKLFKARWWDYSKTKYNIDGRVCADTMIPFGIIACIVIYVLHPAIISVLSKIPSDTLNIITIVILVIFVSDLITSFNVVNNFKKTIKKASLEDKTDDINNYIKEILSKRSLLYRRLLHAFPNSYAIIKKRINKTIKPNTNKKD